jgi:UrcA family protein
MLSNQPLSRAARRWVLALCAAAAAAAGPSVQAQTYSTRVQTKDLDLTSEAGRETLDRRIRSAVRRVCSRPIAGLLAEVGPDLVCRQKAMRDVADARLRVIERAFAARQSQAATSIAPSSVLSSIGAPADGATVTRIVDSKGAR